MRESLGLPLTAHASSSLADRSLELVVTFGHEKVPSEYRNDCTYAYKRQSVTGTVRPARNPRVSFHFTLAAASDRIVLAFQVVLGRGLDRVLQQTRGRGKGRLESGL